MDMKKKFILISILFISNFFLSIKSINAELTRIENKKRITSKSILWNKVNKFNFNSEIIWEKYKDNSSNQINTNKELKRKINTLEEAKDLYFSIKPISRDYINPIRLDPGIYIPNFLNKGEIRHSLITKSSFSGGVGGGTGNQLYSYLLDYGLNERSLISIFYSVNDDPLYDLIKGQSEPTPNYWEIYGISKNSNIFEKDNLNISLGTSIELWKFRSGNDLNGRNIFDTSNTQNEKLNIIGSFSLPIEYEVNKKFSLFLLSGINFLPNLKIESQNINSEYYGEQIYSGWGFNYKLSDNFSFIGSNRYLLKGNNSFDSNLKFSKKNIYSFGIDYFLNPKISIESRITNSFGVTPATSNLTMPSKDNMLYFLGFNYNPWRPDSVRKDFNKSKRYLNSEGLTVNSAFIQTNNLGKIQTGIDSKGNNYLSYKYPLSNKFQYDLTLMQFKDIKFNTDTKKLLEEKFIGQNNIHTRLGGKMILIDSKIYKNGIKISGGRNQDINSKQGFLFGEFINTFELSNSIILNASPKILWSSFSTIKSLGLGVNYKINDNVAIIPEINVPFDNESEFNYSFSLRKNINKEFDIDLYISNALGVNEIGSLLRSESPRVGILLNYPF